MPLRYPHLSLLLRPAHAGRVLVPAPAAPVDRSVRGRGLDGRLPLDRDSARDHHRAAPAGPAAPRRARFYLDPNFASTLKYQNEIIVFLLVSAGLALLVRRSRTLVAERAGAERARGNLARYFSPKVVDTLAERDEPLGRVRRQAVWGALRRPGGLHHHGRGDDAGRGHERSCGTSTAAWRRKCPLRRLPGEVHIGDALLATFGVPDTGRRDATDALACARGMRGPSRPGISSGRRPGSEPLQMGLGLHYGPVVAGDIGSRRNMAFATVGDTTNVTSRPPGPHARAPGQHRGQCRAGGRRRA